MAKIVLGIATSHTPQLHTPAELWDVRVKADTRNKAHVFRKQTHTWEELVDLRKPEVLEDHITLDRKSERLTAGTTAVETLADIYADVKPDVAVIVGNDQHELFLDDIMPAFTVYWGDEIPNIPRSEDQVKRLPDGIHIADPGHVPDQTAVYPGLPDLGLKVIADAMKTGFDVAHSRRLPQVDPDRSILSGIPHAYGFIYRQIMKDEVIPNLPIILNTFYPPNQPTVARCYRFGQMIGEAIASWETDKTVAVFASGGLSHFVIDEDFDRIFLKALIENDINALFALDEKLFQSGTSECKNWVTAAGILSVSNLPMTLLDYIPFYRSLGGNGTGTAYAYWR